MRCRSCDYPLWNIPARNCPECGAAFAPSEYAFMRNAVQFCCPHCDQRYFGTTETGLLDPTSFDCVTCGNSITQDEMVIRPSAGFSEAGTRADTMPWVDRKEVGRVRGFFLTAWHAMVHPARLMRATPQQSGVWPAWVFLTLIVIVTLCLAVLPAIPVMLFPAMIIPQAAGPTGPSFASVAAVIGGVSVVSLAVYGVGTLILTALWTPVVHGLLHLTGGVEVPMRRTCQALLYSGGAYLSAAIPCIGGTIGPIWWLVSAVFMVKEAHRISGARAAFAVLLAPITLFIIGVVAYFGAIFMSISASQQAVATVQIAAQQRSAATTISRQLIDYAEAHDGAAPTHGLALAVDSPSGVGLFIQSTSATFLDDAVVGDTTLEELRILGAGPQRRLAEELGASLPPDVVAHRIGDTVFTYHGIDLLNPPVDLWLVALSPQVTADPMREAITVVATGGSVLEIEPDRLSTELDAQNTLRAAEGLGPLPDPRLVRPNEPATAVRIEAESEADSTEVP